jgi:hypothetical protein
MSVAEGLLDCIDIVCSHVVAKIPCLWKLFIRSRVKQNKNTKKYLVATFHKVFQTRFASFTE